MITDSLHDHLNANFDKMYVKTMISNSLHNYLNANLV